VKDGDVSLASHPLRRVEDLAALDEQIVFLVRGGSRHVQAALAGAARLRLGGC